VWNVFICNTLRVVHNVEKQWNTTTLDVERKKTLELPRDERRNYDGRTDPFRLDLHYTLSCCRPHNSIEYRSLARAIPALTTAMPTTGRSLVFWWMVTIACVRQTGTSAQTLGGVYQNIGHEAAQRLEDVTVNLFDVLGDNSQGDLAIRDRRIQDAAELVVPVLETLVEFPSAAVKLTRRIAPFTHDLLGDEFRRAWTKRPRFTTGQLRFTTWTDFFTDRTHMVAFMSSDDYGRLVLANAVTWSGTNAVTERLPAEPTYSGHSLVGVDITSICVLCPLMARRDNGGFAIPLSLNLLDKWESTILLDANWMVVAVRFDGTDHVEVPPPPAVNPFDVALFMLWTSSNVRIHQQGHMVATVFSQLAVQTLPAGHRVRRLVSDWLHPWVAVANDVYGFDTALGQERSIASTFVPNTVEMYKSYSPRPANANIDATQFNGTLVEWLRRLDPRGDKRVFRVVRRFGALADRFLHDLLAHWFPSEDAVTTDRHLVAWLVRVHDIQQHHGLEQFSQHVAPGIHSLYLSLRFFLDSLMLHSMVHEDLFRTELKPTLSHGDARHFVVESLVKSRANQERYWIHNHPIEWEDTATSDITQTFTHGLRETPITFVH
jgi:hypothetical protein